MAYKAIYYRITVKHLLFNSIQVVR